MNRRIVYIHGQGGCAEEAAHYRPLFPGCEVIGLEYASQSPWEAKDEFPMLLKDFQAQCDSIILIANSIGAFYAMHALQSFNIEKAFFISPIVDMEKMITNMMTWTGVTEEQLQALGTIQTDFGQTLSWEYLNYVRTHPITWTVPTQILYGSRDNLTTWDTIRDFAQRIQGTLTVMEGGEHWFHTKEQMQFLDSWIQCAEKNHHDVNS